jgi:hypothetical protein
MAGAEQPHDKHLPDNDPVSAVSNTHEKEVLVPPLRFHLQCHSSASTWLVRTSIVFEASLETDAAAHRVSITATCGKTCE